MAARQGRQAGVRKRSKIETVVHPRPRLPICFCISISNAQRWQNRSHRENRLKARNATYHAPVQLLQMRMAVKAIIDTWDEASRDQGDDSDVVEFVSEPCYGVRVVLNGVVGCTHSQAYGCSSEETCECVDVCLLDGVVSWYDGEVEYYPQNREADGGNQMTEDVDGLIMQVSQARIALLNRVRLRSVPRDDKVIILLPCREVIPRHDQRILHFLLDIVYAIGYFLFDIIQAVAYGLYDGFVPLPLYMWCCASLTRAAFAIAVHDVLRLPCPE